jgi:hypothetical protein
LGFGNGKHHITRTPLSLRILELRNRHVGANIIARQPAPYPNDVATGPVPAYPPVARLKFINPACILRIY